jgi:hypothetical protein
MAPIDATHAEQAVERVADFFDVADARPREEAHDSLNALREALGLDIAAMSELLAGAGELLSKSTTFTAEELKSMQVGVALGIYLGLTAEQERREAQAVVS